MSKGFLCNRVGCYEELVEAADGRLYCPVCEEKKIIACDNYKKRCEYRQKKEEQKNKGEQNDG